MLNLKTLYTDYLLSSSLKVLAVIRQHNHKVHRAPDSVTTPVHDDEVGLSVSILPYRNKLFSHLQVVYFLLYVFQEAGRVQTVHLRMMKLKRYGEFSSP